MKSSSVGYLPPGWLRGSTRPGINSADLGIDHLCRLRQGLVLGDGDDLAISDFYAAPDDSGRQRHVCIRNYEICLHRRLQL